MSIIAEHTYVGRAVSAPELRFTTGGKATASFRMVEGDRMPVKDASGRVTEWRDYGADGYTDKEQAHFMEVQVWDTAAENLIEWNIEPGDRICVIGTSRIEKWTGQDGTVHYSEKINNPSEIFRSMKFAPRNGPRPAKAPGEAQQQARQIAQQNANQAPAQQQAAPPAQQPQAAFPPPAQGADYDPWAQA